MFGAPELAELVQRRRRIALTIAGITWVVLVLMLALRLAGASIIAPTQSLAGAIAFCSLLLVVCWRWPDVGRRALPVGAALTIVLLTPEPFVSTQISSAVYLPALYAALLAEEWMVVACLSTTVLGLASHTGPGSPYLRPDFLLIASLSGALLVFAQRIVVSVFGRLAAIERRTSAIVAETDDVLIVSRPGPDGQPRPDFVNDAVERVLGYAPKDFLATRVEALVHEADVSDVLFRYGEAAASPGAMVIAEFRLRHTDGRWRWINARITNLLAHPDVGGIVTTMRDVTASVEAREEFERRLAHQAHHDPLTGLANRRLLLEATREALESFRKDGDVCALLFCDVDEFKLVNDSRGHAVGDALLCEIAGRMPAALRSVDLAARFGGDEFVVLLRHLDSPDQAYLVASRLAAALREPVPLGDKAVHVQVSIGVVTAREDHDSPESMLRDADVALYRAKENGKNRVELFEESLRSRVSRRHELEQALRQALPRGQLRLHLQPKYGLGDGRLLGFEALVRWQDPERGFVGPGEFIPIAEETGLVLDIGRWVLREACGFFAAWQETTGTTDGRIAVNVSGRQLQDPGFVEDVARVLRETGLRPEQLELEITESVAMANAAASIERLQLLADLGVSLAVDDFGTGYSSLAYLRRFPVNVIKIDRAFVMGLGKDADDFEIVRFLIGMARTLGLATVAEGVETAEQLATLRALGCDVAQGYLLGRPVAGEDALRAPARIDLLPEPSRPPKSVRDTVRGLVAGV